MPAMLSAINTESSVEGLRFSLKSILGCRVAPDSQPAPVKAWGKDERKRIPLCLS